MLLRERRINVLPRIAQWSELRGFERLYHKNPEAQEKFINNLLAMAACNIEVGDSNDINDAIGTIVVSFTERHSEYLRPTFDLSSHDVGGGIYEADPFLVDQIVALLGQQKLNVSALDGESFERLYKDQPHFQSVFVEVLLGYRAVHTEFGAIDDNSQDVIEAIDSVVTGFTDMFSDYLVDEAMSDCLLVRKVRDLLEASRAA
jgi:hypothetical protein